MPLNPSPEIVFADGPASHPQQPYKPDVRRIFRQIEQIIDAFTSNGGLIYSSKAAMDADLARPANAMAWVLGDAVAANNGIYRKVGVSGSGNWVRAGDLPYSFILASNVGTGTPSAIQATTSIPVSGSALILLQIAEDYSGEAATVSFNGGAPLAIITNSGADVRNLAGGSVVYGVISGATFRLANDEAIASLIYEARDEAVAAADRADAEADRSHDEADRSEAARDIAAGYASDAVSQGNVPIYATVVGMPSLEIPAGINAIRVNGYYAAGDGGGALYVKVDDDPVHSGKFQTADGAWWAISEASVNPRQFGAKGDGVADDSSAFDAIDAYALATTGVVDALVNPGAYLIDADREWIANVRYVFCGGRLINGDGRTQSGVINYRAGKSDKVFGGELARGSYIRTGNVPYDFGWDVDLKGTECTPQHFHAVGDGLNDDGIAIHAAIHAGGTVRMLRGSTYLTSEHIVLRESRKSLVFDDGAWVKSSGASMGQVLGIRGQPPTTASGEPAEWNRGCSIINAQIDAIDATNNNGVGASFAKDFYVSIKSARNIGRKAFTAQYWVKNFLVDIDVIEDASTEPGSTHSALSLEGQAPGLDYSLDGGVSATNDIFGQDLSGGLIRCAGIDYSGYNYVVVQRAVGNTIEIQRAGDCVGAGRHVVLGVYAKKNTIRIGQAGNTERNFVATIAASEDNVIEIDAGDAVGTGADGYSISDAGTRNQITAKFDHSNTATTNGRAVTLLGVDGVMDLLVRSCDSSTIIGGTGTGYTFTPKNRLLSSASRIALIGGADWVFDGGFYNPGTAVGIQIGAPGAIVRGAKILGDGVNRVLVNSGIQNWIVADNHLPGVSPEVSVTTAADLWAAGSKYNNLGDVASLQCIRMGRCIIAVGNGSPEGVVAAAIGSEYVNHATGIKYSKTSGSGATGWVVTGSQS